jgi:threonine/homoserine/homoserine lactone efflux protein
MVDPAVLPGYLTAVFLVTLAPGPDNSYVAAVALQRGSRAGVISALGMSLGMAVHVSVAALGLAVLLHSEPSALLVIQLAGAAYLGWLALTTLGSIGHQRTEPSDVSGALVLRRAVLTNLTNPKVIMFFAAFLPQFTRGGYGPVGLQLLTLGVLFLFVGLLCDALIGFSVGRLGRRLGPGGVAANALTVVAGATFAALAVLLLVEAL